MKTVNTIHDLLPSTRGNITELARILDCHRATISKYIKDKKGEFHAIIDGKLFIKPGFKGRTSND